MYYSRWRQKRDEQKYVVTLGLVGIVILFVMGLLYSHSQGWKSPDDPYYYQNSRG